jgi:hypothetical protein
MVVRSALDEVRDRRRGPLLRRLAWALCARGCNCIDTALRQHEEADDHDDWASDEQDLVPTALVGEESLSRKL